MRKKFISALCALLISLSIYSCSEFILPKQIGVKGTLGLPARIGSVKLNSVLFEEIEKAFSTSDEEDLKVYNVDYEGQTLEAFCIFIPMEITENLNPDDFLKTIDRQINDGISAEPKKINLQPPIPYLGIPILISEINLFNDDEFDGKNKIPSVSLADIARYVITIDFNESNGIDDSAGIGMNFYFSEIPDGLEMILECEGLNISTPPKPLKKGNNIFGNDVPLQLKPYDEDKNDSKQLEFIMTLQSSDPAQRDKLDLRGSGLNIGENIKIEGEMRFFRKWTKAEIDLKAAINVSSDPDMDGLTGKFPNKQINLSRLHKYFSGGFSFNDTEAKIYMNGPDPESINKMNAVLIMEAHYNTRIMNLYNDILSVSEPINMEKYFKDNDVYNSQHLPEITSEYDNKIDEETIADLFKTMPADLFFTYRIEVGEYMTVYPETFADDDGNSSEGSKITSKMVIMLPMSLTAEGDNDKKSAISFPDMFGKGDLFGRKKTGDLFSTADIDYIRMTVDFSDKIFTNGHLFINKDRDLFSQGVELNDKIVVSDVSDEEIEKIQKKLIIPDVKIEIDNGGTVNIPKNAGIVNIQFETKGLIKLGEF